MTQNLLKVKYRWLFVILIMMGMTVTTIQGKIQYNGVIPSLYETILAQTDEANLVCFLFTFLYLVVISDICISTKYKLYHIFLLSLVFVMLFIIANIAICAIQQATFVNKWTNISYLREYKSFPIETVCISLLLLLFRLTSMSLFVALLNRITKVKIWSILFVVVINILDYDIVSILNSIDLVNILPIVNTKVSYTEALKPIMSGEQRVSYLCSFIYWFVIIFILTLFNIILYKKFKRKEKIICGIQ